ncbi:hypothetical protein [Ruminococcus sp.]|uniref:hypothetical protein n=1 Tax=Ruminococcus sp. TaxID=41978 RepID=UPI0025D6EB9B|nr:hypothetical protein [Ruminococcus sp.]MBQ9541997.1 hypothetical protein [Ruminococcus sp.]
MHRGETMVYLAAVLVLITAGLLLGELFRGDEIPTVPAAVVVFDDGSIGLEAQVMSFLREEEALGRHARPVIIYRTDRDFSNAAERLAAENSGVYLAGDMGEVGRIAAGIKE